MAPRSPTRTPHSHNPTPKKRSEMSIDRLLCSPFKVSPIRIQKNPPTSRSISPVRSQKKPNGSSDHTNLSKAHNRVHLEQLLANHEQQTRSLQDQLAEYEHMYKQATDPGYLNWSLKGWDSKDGGTDAHLQEKLVEYECKYRQSTEDGHLGCAEGLKGGSLEDRKDIIEERDMYMRRLLDDLKVRKEKEKREEKRESGKEKERKSMRSEDREAGRTRDFTKEYKEKVMREFAKKMNLEYVEVKEVKEKEKSSSSEGSGDSYGMVGLYGMKNLLIRSSDEGCGSEDGEVGDVHNEEDEGIGMPTQEEIEVERRKEESLTGFMNGLDMCAGCAFDMLDTGKGEDGTEMEIESESESEDMREIEETKGREKKIQFVYIVMKKGEGKMELIDNTAENTSEAKGETEIVSVYATVEDANECVKKMVEEQGDRGWGMGWGMKEGGALYWEGGKMEFLKEGSLKRDGKWVWVERKEVLWFVDEDDEGVRRI